MAQGAGGIGGLRGMGTSCACPCQGGVGKGILSEVYGQWVCDSGRGCVKLNGQDWGGDVWD